MSATVQALILVALIFICYSLVIINRNIGALAEIIENKNEDIDKK